MGFIEEANSVEEYENSWTRCMQHLHQFKNKHPFDYGPDERLEQIRKGFDDASTEFLIAKSDENSIGVIGYSTHGESGMIRGWEPGVVPEKQNDGVGEALLNACFDELREKGMKTAWCWRKSPYESPETGTWYLDLFAKMGLEKQPPGAVQMLLDLRDIEPGSGPVSGFEIVDATGFSSDDLAELTYRTTFSIPEERILQTSDIQDWDKDKVLKKVRDAIHGQLERSYPDCWSIAMVVGEPVGLTGSWMVESQYRPLTAGIGSVGVLPEFRRRGIASALLNNVHRALQAREIPYAFLGVSDINYGAISLYERTGYKFVFQVDRFEKAL